MAQKKTTSPTPFSTAVNMELRVAMARLGLTQTQLVEASGVSQPVISRTIYNNESVLNTNQVEALCTALNTTPSEVFRAAELAIQKQAEYALAAKDVYTREGEDGIEYYEG